MKEIAVIVLLIFCFLPGYAQEGDVLNKLSSRVGNFGNSQGGRDTIGFEHRDDSKDSIAITYKYLDSIRSIPFDSSINDFDKYFSVPSSYLYLGNNGAAAYSIVYEPYAKPGWDAGFHAFDVYEYTLEGTRFYKINRPFSQLSYQLASGKEQMIKMLHTQSPRPNINFGFDYRLISAPGFFVTQNSHHKNFRLFGNYQGKKKRYGATAVLLGNTRKNSENGGIRSDSLLDDPNYKKRFSVPVNLGNAGLFEPSPFQTKVSTGNIYKDLTVFIRQTYDIGKKDSIAINDSTTEYLFYPKLRMQHSFTYSSYDFTFKDELADSAGYYKWYDTIPKFGIDSFFFRDKWKVMTNDFTLLSFPDTKNSGQFISAGINLQNIKGELKGGTKSFYNLSVHGEYRNKTRNKLWDVLAKGEFYVNGLNSGDYSAYATIARHLNNKLGDISLFFKNVSRTPSFVFNDLSNFNLANQSLTKKENIISLGAEVNNRFVKLNFKNHIINNLAYFTDYYHIDQSSKTINLLQLTASKKIRLTKRWNLYSEIAFQQTDGAAPIKVPLLFTRNRFAYEGVYFKNLNLSTGIEFRYFTPFNANNYSPVMGSFFAQDSIKIKNLPDVHAFLHFRIKSFTAYLRAENLNTISFANGFGFTNNNFAAPNYPTQGFIFRFGIQWAFVN